MTTNATMIFGALAVVGILMILLAIRNKEFLISKPVLDMNAEKMGLALKTNAFGLLILLAVFMMSMSVFFLYQDYEKKLLAAKKASDAQAGEIKRLNQVMTERDKVLDEATQKLRDTMDEITSGLKEYQLRLALSIPNNEANPYHSEVLAYVQQKGDNVEKPYEVGIERGFGGIVVNFSSLHIGDRLYVVVRDSDIGKTWISEHMTIPETVLRMTEQELN